MNPRKMTPDDWKRWRHKRHAMSVKPGTKWIFFRNGDDPKHTGDYRHPWAGHTIEIVSARKDRHGKWDRRARPIHPELQTNPRHTRPIRVAYSELC